MVNSTYIHARRLGAGGLLQDRSGRRYVISDWSNATCRVYGRGPKGRYGQLPDDLTPIQPPKGKASETQA